MLGGTHCYSASGTFDNGTAILDIVARGCIDCSGEMQRFLVNALILLKFSHTSFTAVVGRMRCFDVLQSMLKSKMEADTG